MTTTCSHMPASGTAITPLVAPSAPQVVIRTVQPDRDHAVLEMVGVPGHDAADELRQRLQGLLVAGVRHLLVDLSEAGPADGVADALREAGRQLKGRGGWLRIHQDLTWPMPAGLSEATPAEVFAIYRAFGGSTDGRNGRRVGQARLVS
jgi:hypothetical protein